MKNFLKTMLEKIKNTIKLTTDVYLEKHLPRITQDKKTNCYKCLWKRYRKISYVYL